MVCPGRTYTFDHARSYVAYEGALVRAIIMLKFEHIEPLGVWFAERLVEVFKRNVKALAAAIVVPVPLHRQHERERGCNQWA
jgi:predicted amidophosphoribosyltransferase